MTGPAAPSDAIGAGAEPPGLIAARRRLAEAADLQSGGGADDYNRRRAATDLLVEAARGLSLSEFPVDYAIVHAELAGVLLRRAQAGDPDVLHEAIDSYFKALIVFNRDEFPEAYARCYHGLGLAQWTAGNLDAARVGFESVLEVFTPEVAPVEHAQARANVAAVLAAMPQPEPRREAVRIYTAVVDLVSAAEHPRERAELELALGQALNVQLDGSPTENVEAALAAFARAAELAESAAAPDLATEAHAQRAVALAGRSRLTGEGVDAALAALEAAVGAFDPTTNPDRHADLQLHLGRFAHEAGGAAGTRRAIAALEAVQAIRERVADPTVVGDAVLLLGDAYLRLATTDPATYRPKALALEAQALAAWPREQFPAAYAAVQLMLGRAHALAAATDPLAAAAALAALEAGLDAVSREADPDVYADLQLNLGMLLQQRTDGDRIENLRRAAQAYDRVLEARPAAVDPHRHGSALHRLGLVSMQQPDADPTASLSAAAEHFQAAASVRSRAVDPAGFAESQLLRGIALAGASGRDDTARLRAAVTAYREALTVYDRHGSPREFASTHNNLAAALDTLAAASDGDTDADLREAIASYELAASVFTADAFAQQHAAIQANLNRARARLQAVT